MHKDNNLKVSGIVIYCCIHTSCLLGWMHKDNDLKVSGIVIYWFTDTSCFKDMSW